MKYQSNYNRHVHIGDSVEWIKIYRFECMSCNRTHAILPDFICPRKHYSACDIEFVLKDVEDNIPAEDIETTASISTVKRWIKEFGEKVKEAAGSLKSLLYTIVSKTISEIVLSNLTPFKLLERLLKEFPEIDNSNFVIGEANIWLLNNTAGIYI